MKTHKDLDVWQKSIQFVTDIYNVTKEFPDEEKYCLVNQIRRSAVSIPSNIAEGSARQTKKEFIQFLYISLGSAAELNTQLMISENLDFIKDSKNLLTNLEDIQKMLMGLIKYLKND